MFQRRPTEIAWVLIAAMVLAPCAACQQQSGTAKSDAGKPGAGNGDARRPIGRMVRQKPLHPSIFVISLKPQPLPGWFIRGAC